MDVLYADVWEGKFNSIKSLEAVGYKLIESKSEYFNKYDRMQNKLYYELQSSTWFDRCRSLGRITQMIKIRNVKLSDLPSIVAIENCCFTKEEAATKEAFEKRIRFTPDSFFVAEVDGAVVGLVNGPVISKAYITDDLFSDSKENPASHGHQSILGLAVSQQFQKRGVATALLAHMEREAVAKKRETMTLTCKENLLPFYEKLGYINKGISQSQHGGVAWYNMIKILS
jgi:ribosomal protein S18 acetylase RimI-like enzyme